MKKMLIKRALNLDNVRCFLYGCGSNDVCENEEMYARGALYQWISGGNPVKAADRLTFLQYHFGSAFTDTMLELFLCGKEEKEKNDFIMEISDRKRSKRGTGAFLDTICRKYMENADGFTLPELVRINRQVLAKWNLECFNKELLDFIHCLLEAECNEYNKNQNEKTASVCHILDCIRDMAAANAGAQSFEENNARVLALLLLAALLREKFPLTLLNTNAVSYSGEEIYHMGNLFAGVQVNLNALIMQLNSQENFLREAMKLFAGSENPEHIGYFTKEQERKLAALTAYYSLQLRQIEKVSYLMDYTDMEKKLKQHKLRVNESALFFLHDAAYYMEDFAKEGMKQFLSYISTGIKYKRVSFHGIEHLGNQYAECILWYRRLIYWNIISLCRGIPYEVIKDMNVHAGYINPQENGDFFVYIKMQGEEIKEKISCMERNFRTAMNRVADHNITIVFPEIFYAVDFSGERADLKLRKVKGVRFISGGGSINQERAIIDLFFEQLKQMDRICRLHSNMLDILSGMSDIPNDIVPAYAKQIKPVIKKYRQLLQAILKLPPIIIGEPMSEYMRIKDIKTIEFQNFCSYLYDFVMENLRYIDLIEESCPAVGERFPEYETHCLNAQNSQKYVIAYLNCIPNYWFAGWSSEALEYIREKSQDLSMISINWEIWASTRHGAEGNMAKVLDSMENELLRAERATARKTWELMDMKVKIDKMMSELPKA